MAFSTRREFLKSAAIGGIGAPLALRTGLSGGMGPGQAERRENNGMFYRRLGRTDLWISEISLGSSPLPDWTVFRTILDRGVNYVDSSHGYSRGNSERQIGRAMREVGRDNLHIGTKFHIRGDWRIACPQPRKSTAGSSAGRCVPGGTSRRQMNQKGLAPFQ